MKSFYTSGDLVNKENKKNAQNNFNFIDDKCKKKTKKEITDELIANRMRENLRRRRLSIKEGNNINNHES